MQMSKKCVLRIGLILVFLCAILAAVLTYKRGSQSDEYLSENGYEKALGVKRLSYDGFSERYGLPQKTARRHDDGTVWRTEDYDGFRLHLVEHGTTTEEPWFFLAEIEIWDPQITFGRQKIRVGSTKEEVMRAYAADIPCNREWIAPGAWHGATVGFYFKKFHTVLFAFDNEDCVERIILVNIW